MAKVLSDLLYLMAKLRDPETGCPWDLKQSANDIINYSIEEAYELADSVEANDYPAIKDELGDVLFQVLFLSRIAEEQRQFNFEDVATGCIEKLVRRHPHVFPDGQLYGESARESDHNVDTRQVLESWERIKKQERQAKNQTGIFDDVPHGLPALNRAAKLQKRAASIGLDWPNTEGPLLKIQEELEELQSIFSECEFNEGNASHEVVEEVGDLLFSTVNFCRKAGISPEQALRLANQKFVRRVESVSRNLPEAASQKERPIASQTTLEQLWEIAKKEDV